jgi:hypothetical protein
MIDGARTLPNTNVQFYYATAASSFGQMLGAVHISLGAAIGGETAATNNHDESMGSADVCCCVKIWCSFIMHLTVQLVTNAQLKKTDFKVLSRSVSIECFTGERDQLFEHASKVACTSI